VVVVVLWTLAVVATIWVLAPSVVYAALAPDHTPFVNQCGQIKTPNGVVFLI